MRQRQRLTNNADETEVGSLMAGDSIFTIPYFQRPYRWKSDRLDQLNSDLLKLVDGRSDFHFLGAVIVHGRRTNPADPNIYEVIDGQQRITTIFLYICAIVKTLCTLGEHDEAAALLLKYLLIGRPVNLVSNAKLHSSKDDRAQLNAVIKDLLADEGLRRAIAPVSYSELPATGADAGKLRRNYKSALQFFAEQANQEGIERVRSLYRALLGAMSVVQIDVWDPTNGPKIFDSLNSRQEPMTTGDLVRNEIFSKVADQTPADIEKIDIRAWQPFYKKFRVPGHPAPHGEPSRVRDSRSKAGAPKSHPQSEYKDFFDAYFFPFGLILDPNLRKSDVYARLRDQWSAIDDPERIIEHLSEYQDAFLDLMTGDNRQGHGNEIAAAVKRLFDLGAPSSTLPFLMQLSNSARSGRVDVPVAVQVYGVVESFLVRRALCGHEPTGLHAVFKRLWSDCGGQPTQSAVTNAIRSHRTVVWPSDDEVRESVRTRPLGGSAIAPFFLSQWDASLGGDEPNIRMQIEHVLPQTPVDEWFDGPFTRQEHSLMVDRLANLLPLSEQMNKQLSNRLYSAKRDRYLRDAAFKATRDFAERYESWDARQLDERGEQLAEWAVRRWQF